MIDTEYVEKTMLSAKEAKETEVLEENTKDNENEQREEESQCRNSKVVQGLVGLDQVVKVNLGTSTRKVAFIVLVQTEELVILFNSNSQVRT